MRHDISWMLIKILQPFNSFSMVFEILYHLSISILILFAKTCIKVKVPKWWCQIREVLGKRGGKGICACPFKNVKICCTFTSKFCAHFTLWTLLDIERTTISLYELSHDNICEVARTKPEWILFEWQSLNQGKGGECKIIKLRTFGFLHIVW